jgi:ADP-ribose pyrophosphatase
MNKVVNREKLFSARLLTIYKKSVQNNDDSIWEREVVTYGGSAAVVLAEYEGKIILVSQFRPTAEKYFLELPAGRIKKGEQPIQCAKREFEEETGLVPLNLEEIISFYPSPGFVDEKMHLFYANKFNKGSVNFDPGEELKTVLLPVNKIDEYINGKIDDGKTLIGLLMWRMLKDEFK